MRDEPSHRSVIPSQLAKRGTAPLSCTARHARPDPRWQCVAAANPRLRQKRSSKKLVRERSAPSLGKTSRLCVRRGTTPCLRARRPKLLRQRRGLDERNRWKRSAIQAASARSSSVPRRSLATMKSTGSKRDTRTFDSSIMTVARSRYPDGIATTDQPDRLCPRLAGMLWRLRNAFKDRTPSRSSPSMSIVAREGWPYASMAMPPIKTKSTACPVSSTYSRSNARRRSSVSMGKFESRRKLTMEPLVDRTMVFRKRGA